MKSDTFHLVSIFTSADAFIHGIEIDAAIFGCGLDCSKENETEVIHLEREEIVEYMHYLRCKNENKSFICHLSMKTNKRAYGPFASHGAFLAIWPNANFESSGPVYVNSINEDWWFYDQYRIRRSLLDFFTKFAKIKRHENQMNYFDGFWSKLYSEFFQYLSYVFKLASKLNPAMILRVV